MKTRLVEKTVIAITMIVVCVSFSACTNKSDAQVSNPDKAPVIHEGLSFLTSLDMGKDLYPESAGIVVKINDLLEKHVSPNPDPDWKMGFNFLGQEPQTVSGTFMNTYWRKPSPGDANYYAFKGVDIPDANKTVYVNEDTVSIKLERMEIGVRLLRYKGWVNSLTDLQLLSYQFADDADNPDNNWVNSEKLLLNGSPAVFEQFTSVNKHGPSGSMGPAWINTCISRLSVAKNGWIYQAFVRETDEYQDGNTLTYTANFLPASTIEKLFNTLKLE